MKEYEKDGIVFVEDSEIVDFLDFGCERLDCAFICGNYDESSSSGVIVAYARKPEYDRVLREVFAEKYQKKGYMYSLGISSDMVDSLDFQ